MKSQQSIAALAALVIAGAAMADGDHAHGTGGHTHDAKASVLGEPGKAAEVGRTVELDMFDTMRFKPAMIEVKQGETIRFRIRNSGQVKHEMVLGTPQELKEHYAMMMKMPDMEHHEPNMVTVAPGQTGELIWRFTNARVVDFACLQPGHYGAGMKGQVKVTR
jgi:uncharacterized cupredoxin-like copper-binding protein